MEQGELQLDERTPSPAEAWSEGAAKRALDELFQNTRQYRSAASFSQLMKFTRRFRFYSPYNAMLVHTQMQGATYVATASRWARDFRRTIRPGSQPLVILQPMGPVMFVFDVAHTEPLPGAPALPREVESPFEVRHGKIAGELDLTVHNAVRDGILIEGTSAGSQHAGSIQPAAPGQYLDFQLKWRPLAEFVKVPRLYHLLLNDSLSDEAAYATLVHELGHLFAGHLGTPNAKWWPDRRGLNLVEREFEAESICYLVCGRLGIDNPSDEYLSGYLKAGADIPDISLDCVMKAAGLIESMARERLGLRK